MDPHHSGLPDEADATYRYFLDCGTTPVCVCHDAHGVRRMALVPRGDARELRRDATWLSRLETSDEMEEIDRSTFDAACQRIWHRIKP